MRLAAPGSVVTEVGSLLQQHRLAVVDMWAAWCGPCQRLVPILEELETEFGGRVAFVKVNVDADPAIAEAYSVGAIPTLLLFRDAGRAPETLAHPYSRQALADKLNAELSK